MGRDVTSLGIEIVWRVDRRKKPRAGLPDQRRPQGNAAWMPSVARAHASATAAPSPTEAFLFGLGTDAVAAVSSEPVRSDLVLRFGQRDPPRADLVVQEVLEPVLTLGSVTRSGALVTPALPGLGP